MKIRNRSAVTRKYSFETMTSVAERHEEKIREDNPRRSATREIEDFERIDAGSLGCCCGITEGSLRHPVGSGESTESENEQDVYGTQKMKDLTKLKPPCSNTACESLRNHRKSCHPHEIFQDTTYY